MSEKRHLKLMEKRERYFAKKMPIGESTSPKPYHDISWSELIVGKDTDPSHVHLRDTVAWLGNEGVTYTALVTGITKDNIIIVMSGVALVKSAPVKISCPHVLNPTHK